MRWVWPQVRLLCLRLYRNADLFGGLGLIRTPRVYDANLLAQLRLLCLGWGHFEMPWLIFILRVVLNAGLVEVLIVKELY